MIKLIAFDLDGTLTQHKTPLEKKNREVLSRLAEKYSLVMVGAGTVARIHGQLGGFPIDIIGSYGLECSEFDGSTGGLLVKWKRVLPCDRESVADRIEECRRRFGFLEYRGESVEFHPSGAVTFPILGTNALKEDKLAFDPDRRKRRAIYGEICKVFPDYRVFIGGSSSFDMIPEPYDKKYALELYCREKGYRCDEVLFVGDDYGEGGNDEPVYRSDFGFRKTDDYRSLEYVLSDLL